MEDYHTNTGNLKKIITCFYEIQNGEDTLSIFPSCLPCYILKIIVYKKLIIGYRVMGGRLIIGKWK